MNEREQQNIEDSILIILMMLSLMSFIGFLFAVGKTILFFIDKLM